MKDTSELKADFEAGRPVHFSRKTPISDRTIPAQIIVESAQVSKKIEIKNAVIEGQLNLKNSDIPSEIILLHCHLQDGADFSCSILQRNLTLSFCEFAQKANFQSMTCKYDLRITGAKFDCTNINFKNIHVAGNFLARKANFRGKAAFDDAKLGPDVEFGSALFKSVSFNSVRIQGDGHFTNAVFEHETDFSGTKTEGDLDFQGTRFTDPQTSSYFDVLKVGGDLSFAGAAFTGDTSLDGIQVHGAASFENTKFLRGDANFDDAKIDGDLTFENAQIDGKARFVGLIIGGGGIFRGAQFNSDTKTRFDLSHFKGGLFSQGIKFSGEVDFRGVQIDLDARFCGAMFHGGVSFEASKFTGLAEFRSGRWADTLYPGPLFKQGLSLKHTSFEHDAHYDDAVFVGKADFRDTIFRIVYFSDSGKVQSATSSELQFQGEVDLRGCIYKAVVANWRFLVPRNQTSVAYNRQPYTQLEKFFSGSGETELADEVYLERRKAERQWKWVKKRHVAWFIDLLYFLLLRYGVRPLQLLILSTLLLMLGTMFFSQPYTVSAKEKTQTAPTKLGACDALEFSIHQFLPVDIPLGEQWVPSSEGIHSKPGISIRPNTFAGLVLRLPGWILVPLGIASFTRLLRGAGTAKMGGE
ncbi:MAG TPA: pentapeptide repeat-containing protein [Candidatus Angelobacter sp.]|nr:pentapeptide repeat-containing protein [Candidatus Angelobacter sp.]